MRRGLTPELLDVTVHSLVVLFQLLLPFGSFSTGEELLHNSFRSRMLLVILETSQCAKISLASLLERGDG